MTKCKSWYCDLILCTKKEALCGKLWLNGPRVPALLSFITCNMFKFINIKILNLQRPTVHQNHLFVYLLIYSVPNECQNLLKDEVNNDGELSTVVILYNYIILHNILEKTFEKQKLLLQVNYSMAWKPGREFFNIKRGIKILGKLLVKIY